MRLDTFPGVVEALLRLRADLGTAEVRPSIEPLPLGHVFVRNGDVLACIKGAEVLKRRGVAAEAAGEDGGAPLHTAARLGAGAIVAPWTAEANMAMSWKYVGNVKSRRQTY